MATRRGFSISGTTNVVFEAGSSIRLIPGFHAVAGTGQRFRAFIGNPPQANGPVITPVTGTYGTSQSATNSQFSDLQHLSAGQQFD